MSADPYDRVPPQAKRFSPDDVLPPVEPPSVTFLLQLFVIPLMIVSIIVVLWLLFSWMASATIDPQQMLQEIGQNKEASWQRAVTLASLLQNPDKQYAALRKDPEFARELGNILTQELKTTIDDPQSNVQRLEKRYFLCRALGQMQTPEVIPPLLEAAMLERNVSEVEVRLGALESLALLATTLGPAQFQNDSKAMETLLACSRASDESLSAIDGQSADYRPNGEVRGEAAFALGVVGGEAATARLRQMLEDPYPSARYNAATGLARSGDEQALPVIAEMLEGDNTLASQEEKNVDDKNGRRFTVLKNGIAATVMLAKKNSNINHESLKRPLKVLAESDSRITLKDPAAQAAIRAAAQDAINQIQ